MIRKGNKILCFCLIFVLLVLAGCGHSQATSAKADLTKSEVLNIIAKDLSYHGVNAKTLAVTKLTMKNSTSAIVEYTVTMHDGSKKGGKLNFVKEDGHWEIAGHRH